MSLWITLEDDALTVENVEQVLAPIQDNIWVATACLDRIVDDVTVQKALLDLGLERTQTATPAEEQLCRLRVSLLERLDRLNTFVEISKTLAPESDDAWADDPWEKAEDASPSTSSPVIPLSHFLQQDLLQSSLYFSTAESFAALHTLLLRHGPVLWPTRFTILASIAEHIHPSQFSDLLPAFDFQNNVEQVIAFTPWRQEPDWVESPEITRLLEPVEDVSAGVGKTSPLTATELSDWYKDRVNRILDSTGMVDIALATVQHGASQGIPDLDAVGEELSLLSRLVYDAPHSDDDQLEEEDWTLERWYSLKPIDVVRSYVAHSTPESLSKDISRLVMPYLFVLEARAERQGSPNPLLPKQLLYEFILTSSLEVAAAVFEASKPTLAPGQRLIRDDEDIARLALACLYGSNNLDQWPTMSRIFECLPAWDLQDAEDEDAADTTVASLGAFVTPSTTSGNCTASDLLVFFMPLPISSLSRALDILDVHLESGEIFARWSVPAPLRWFLQSNADINEQRSWATRMARRAGGSEDQLQSQEDWEWLLEDMLKLCGRGDTGLRGAFGLIPRQEVKSIFLGGLLSSGNFIIAKSLIHSSKLSIDTATIESVCLATSREFYDNASLGNYKFGEMKLAYECLSVPTLSDAILKEKEFIEATSRLSSFKVMSGPGNPISPLEIRLTKDRLTLISRVLSSNNDAYKHTEVILDLVYKLGFRDDPLAEVKALAMLTDTALQAEDFGRAFEASQRMIMTVLALRDSSLLDAEKIEQANEVCWVACFQLGRQPEFEDVDKKLSLLSRSIELCPPDKIPDVLGVWLALESEDIEKRKVRVAAGQSGTSARKRAATVQGKPGSSLRERLQQFHMPSTPLLNTPDAAALASRTFRSVTANFPFSVNRTRSQNSQHEDASAQATRVFSKGIGWLIGDDA